MAEGALGTARPTLLRGGGDEGGGGVGGGVVEVNFFDEADCELVIDEPDVFGGINARTAGFERKLCCRAAAG